MNEMSCSYYFSKHFYLILQSPRAKSFISTFCRYKVDIQKMKIRGNHKTCVALLLDLRLLERVADAGPHQSKLRDVLAVPPVPATGRRPRGLPQSHQIHLGNRYSRYARYTDTSIILDSGYSRYADTAVCNPSDLQCDIVSGCNTGH